MMHFDRGHQKLRYNCMSISSMKRLEIMYLHIEFLSSLTFVLGKLLQEQTKQRSYSEKLLSAGWNLFSCPACSVLFGDKISGYRCSSVAFQPVGKV